MSEEGLFAQVLARGVAQAHHQVWSLHMNTEGSTGLPSCSRAADLFQD